jgi:cytosine/adenosine deaminase-related metal-dependent hydrolase
MQFLSADVIFPVNGSPVPAGILVVEDDGSIIGIIDPAHQPLPSGPVETYKGFLCPGFINAHCHLELSWSKGLIPEGNGLDAFVRELETMRKIISPENEILAMESAAAAMLGSGVVAVGDISNTSLSASVKENSSLRFHTFCEVFASDPTRAAHAFAKISEVYSAFGTLSYNSSASITPHATYSVSEELMGLITNSQSEGALISIHHQESPDEKVFFLEGSGAIARRRQLFNPGLPAFKPTGKTPLETISANLRKDQKLLLVHNTFAFEEDVYFAIANFPHTSWCLCPNANLYIEQSLPPVGLFREKGCNLLLGTDSLASNHSLSILEELKTLTWHFPDVPLCEMLSWATKNGADYFGFEKMGSFEQGRKPGVVWIKNVDAESMTLLPESTSELIIPA